MGERMLPGDLVIFSGNAWISKAIKLFTASPVTHCGVVRWAADPSMVGAPSTPYNHAFVTQSTITQEVDGPQTTAMGSIVDDDYKGKVDVAWLPLSRDARSTFDAFKFYQFIGAIEDHAHYDKAGLGLYAAKDLPIIGPLIKQSPNPYEFFCSAYAIAIYEACGVLRGINSRKVSPQGLCEIGIWDRQERIFGKDIRIKGLNTL